MTPSTCFSVAKVIDKLIAEVVAIKQKEPLAEISILAPNALLCQSINHTLLQRDIPIINLFIETTQQHFFRKTEIAVMAQGGMLDRSEVVKIFHELLQKYNFDYFKEGIKEFSSYPWLFADTIQKLRLNLTKEELILALPQLEQGAKKGDDILSLLECYLAEKGVKLDYADMVELYSRDEKDFILSFPETLSLLSKHESKALNSALKPVREIQWDSITSPKVEVSRLATLSKTHEVREVLRRIICKNLVLDKTVVILPDDYLAYFIAEAKELNLPVKSNQGQAKTLKEGLLLMALIDIIISNYGYNELKECFYLQHRHWWIKKLSQCGVAAGREPLESKLKELEGCDKILEFLEQLNELEELQANPAKLVAEILTKPIMGKDYQNLAIIKSVCEEVSRTTEDNNLKHWRLLLQRRLDEVRFPLLSDPKGVGKLLLTSELNPGAFDHVFCLGMTESKFPRKFREGPLLLDAELEQLNQVANGNLQTAEFKNRMETERLERLIGIANVSWTVSYPKIDLMKGSSEFASPYLDLQKSLLPEDLPLPRLPEKPESCLSEHEWLLQHLEYNREDFVEYWKKQGSSVKNHLLYEEGLWDKDSPELIGDIFAVKPKLTRDTFSPSQLDKLIACPFKWLVEKIYRIKPLDAPETAHSMSALTQGNIIHAILEEYLNKLIKDKTVDNPEEWLYCLLDEKLKEQYNTLGPNAKFYLARDLRSMQKSLDSFLEYQKNLGTDRQPVCSELSFGNSYRECSIYPDPVVLNLDGIELKLSGSIDRVDRRDDTAWIIDYKNSTNKKYKTKELTNLSALQPLLYCVALGNLAEGKGIKKFSAGFLPLKLGNEEYTAEYNDEAKEYLKEVISYIHSLFEVGWFPINTGDDESTPCRYCDYSNVCGGLKVFIAKRQWQKAPTKRPELKSVIASFEKLKEGDL